MRADLMALSTLKSWRRPLTESGIQGLPIWPSWPRDCLNSTELLHDDSSNAFCCHPSAACAAVFQLGLLATVAVVPSAYCTYSPPMSGGASLPLPRTTYITDS